MPDTSVKYFNSTMTGAPTLSGTAGALIGVLDACLVNGFGSVTLDSLTVSENVATGTKSSGHNFSMIGSAVGPVILIEGATPSALNGEWRIASVPTSSTFTFVTTGISDQTATGTITAKRAPAGFDKAFSDTNKAAYSRTALDATAMLLRVDDTPAQYPTLTMYESMTTVDSGSGASTTVYFCRSSAASSESRTWQLFADDLLFYLFADADASTWPSAMCFGDLVNYKSGDAYHCLLNGHPAASSVSALHTVNGTTTGSELARSWTQTGSKVSASRYSHYLSSHLGVGGLQTPNLADGAIHCWPVVCHEGTTIARGLMPGLYCPIHNELQPNGTVMPGERVLFVQQIYSASYRAAFDLTGPWR